MSLSMDGEKKMELSSGIAKTLGAPLGEKKDILESKRERMPLELKADATGDLH